MTDKDPKTPLAQMMDRKKLKQADLLRRLAAAWPDQKFTKQTIYKLYHGEIKISVEWAQKLGPALEIPWQIILEPTAYLESPYIEGFDKADISPPSAASVLKVRKGVGSRISFVRKARMRRDLPDVVADLLGIKVSELHAFEAGVKPIPPEVLIAFCGEFSVSPEFVLMGNAERVDEGLRKDLPKMEDI